MKPEAVIVGAARTPQGKLLGSLKDVPAVELGESPSEPPLNDQG